MAKYIIDETTLVGFGDQARRLGNVEGELTTAQMKEIFEGVTTGSELPNAEESSFGVIGDSKEYGFATVGEIQDGGVRETVGYSFTVAEAFSLLGFRITGVNMDNPAKVALWDADGNIVAQQSITWTAGAWVESFIDTPVNLVVGNTYTFGVYGRFTDKFDSATFNGKLINTSFKITGGAGLNIPTTINASRIPSADIIIGQVAEEMPDEYKIQRVSMDDIAEEAQRIVGQETKMSIAQIKAGLQGVVLQEKTVTPTDTEQEITPDEGYYGLFKVTVGAGGSGENTGMSIESNASGTIPEYESSDAISTLDLSNMFDASAVGTLTS